MAQSTLSKNSGASVPTWFGSRAKESDVELAAYGAVLGPALKCVLTGTTNLVKAESGLEDAATRLDLMVVAVVVNDNLRNLVDHNACLRALDPPKSLSAVHREALQCHELIEQVWRLQGKATVLAMEGNVEEIYRLNRGKPEPREQFKLQWVRLADTSHRAVDRNPSLLSQLQLPRTVLIATDFERR